MMRAALILVLGACLAGCSTQRWLEIQSEPSGATVYVNGVRSAETTPMRIPFVHYGGFDVRLEKTGYNSHSEYVEIPSEIDGYPIVDLPYELLVREKGFARSFRLVPLLQSPTRADAAAALERAKAARAENEREAAAMRAAERAR